MSNQLGKNNKKEEYKTKAQLREEERQKVLDQMETRVDETEFVVIDLGTGTIKAGFSGEDMPRVVIPSVKQSEKNKQQDKLHDQNIDKYEDQFGNKANEYQCRKKESLLNKKKDDGSDQNISQPIQDQYDKSDKLKNKDDLQKILNYIFYEQLNVETSKTPVMICDQPLNKSEKRQEIAKILFESFKVPKLSIMNTSVLSLFSTGRTRGCIVESGESVTHIVPIFEGYALPHAIQKLDIAGRKITKELQRNINKGKDVPVLHKHQMDHIQSIKEQMCSVAVNYNEAIESNDPLDINKRSQELPDGSMLEVDHKSRFTSTEILFNSKLLNKGQYPLHELVHKAIYKCDNDLQNDLWNNIVLAGGNTMLLGFCDRLKYELQKSLQTDVNLEITTDPQRYNAAWIGGSMLSSMDVFGKYSCIPKDDWEETQGQTDQQNILVQKKCFN